MSLKFENFLGKDLVIPEDLFYEPIEGLWIRELNDGTLAIGMTEPTVLMAGTVREIEVLVEDQSNVKRGETAILALTSKLKYIAAPVSGKFSCPPDLSVLPEKIVQDPYGTAIFFINPDSTERENLINAERYLEELKNSDGARNPGGHKGGVSPTCKAVYMAIGEQNITEK